MSLRHTKSLVDRTGRSIAIIDATVGLKRPKLARHIPLMRKQISKALGIKPNQVSLKAKSGEAVRADPVALVARFQ